MATHPARSRTDSGTVAGRPDWLAVALGLGGLLCLFYLVPVVSLFLSVSPGTVAASLGDPDVVGAAKTTLLSAAVTSVVATAFGLPLAYWLARAESRWTSLVLGVVVLPLVLPPTVGGIVLLSVFGPNAPLGEVATAAGFQPYRSFLGVVLAQTFVASPFVVVTAKAAFEAVPRELEHASRSLGKNRLTTALRVTLPLAAPGILAGVTLTFARAMGEFGATMMVSYYPMTLPVKIWTSFNALGLDGAYPVAVVLLVLSAVALALLNTLAANPWE